MQIERINDLILIELAEAINREVVIPNALVTVTFVDCDKDLKKAKVGFSVLPDNMAGNTLRTLKKTKPKLIAILKKRKKKRKLPHFNWEFDATEREAEKLEKLIAEAE